MKFRYSAIDTAYSCLRKYKLIYVDGVESGDTSIDLSFGTGLHTAIKSAFDGEDPRLTFSMYWQSVESIPFNKSRYSWEQLKALGEDFIDRFMRLHFKKFKPFKTEEQFEIEIAGQPFTGTADFIGHYDGVPGVWDWKTSGPRYKHSKLLKNPQLWIYAHAAKEAFGFHAEQVGYKTFVKSEESIQTLTHPVTEEKLKSMMTDVEAMVKDLAARTEFPRSPNCFCAFPQLCYPNEVLRNE